MVTKTMEDSKIKQIRRDLARAKFYVEQMNNADSKLRKYYYGIQAIVFGAIVKVRYQKQIEELQRDGFID